MSRFNKKAVSATSIPVVNHQGGTGYKLDAKTELVGLLVSSTDFNNTYYESLNDREKRLKNLIQEVASKDPEFVGKAIVYTRAVIGNRSVTHFAAVCLLPFISGTPFATRFFTKRHKKLNMGGVIRRVDDMSEIMAVYQAFNKDKRFPNAMTRGFKSVIENSDAYELAKYQSKGKNIKLVDIVRLTHPVSNDKNRDALKQLIEGTLTQFNTVEDKNVKSGQEVAAKVKSGEITKKEAEKELSEAKEDNFKELIMEGKIGYLALLRNLRNILNVSSNSGLINAACKLLTDEKLIRQSLVMPHQIDIAMEILLTEFSTQKASKFITATNKAYELSIPNLKEVFTHGKTAVVVDTSGSMEGGWSGKVRIGSNKTINKSPKEKAALIGATFAKGIDADLYKFASECGKVNYNLLDSVNTIKNLMLTDNGRLGHGTHFNNVFKQLNKVGYDRIFIISDMQCGDNITRMGSEFTKFKNKFGNPHIYSIDLLGYGTSAFKPNDKLYKLFGYSKDIYELAKTVEVDPKVLMKTINDIVI